MAKKVEWNSKNTLLSWQNFTWTREEGKASKLVIHGKERDMKYICK
ncbi:hypothetical protein HanRHA438_Chr04g0162121 [Helianthus annuus]|nr:hypothetical protein HanRHA438_Chr04g0162121 [Helianthus annuus]